MIPEHKVSDTMYMHYTAYSCCFTPPVGQLHSRIGLIQSSLGMYSEAVQSFERALPLVRMSATTAEVGETAALKMEASILQNIGAVHNERGNYSDAVIYNMAAARLNGVCGIVVYSSLTDS